MSVLDRAIIKAYERRRMSAADASAANVVRGTTDRPAQSAEDSSATKTIDSMEQLLVEIGIASSVSPPIVVSPPAADLPYPFRTEPLPPATTVPAITTPEIAEPSTAEPAEPIVDSPPQNETPPPPAESSPPPPSQVDVVDIPPAHLPIPSVPAAPPVRMAVPDRQVEKYVAPGLTSESRVSAATPVAISTAPTVKPVAQAMVSPSSPATPKQPGRRDWKWPEICEQLDQFTGDGFRQLAKHLQFAAAQGHKVLAFVSSKPGAGRTSVLLTLTRILALEGRTDVLLLDADRRHPDLAKLTGLTPTVGLCEVLHGQSTLQQAVVPRTPGNIAMLPLLTPVSDVEWPTVVTPLRALVKQLRRDHDMILVDAGVFGPETRLADCWLKGAADAVITISRQLNGKNAVHDVLNWKQIGIESLGVIETFA